MSQGIYGGGGPYRSRHGLVFGVCAGIAEYFDFSVFWTRMFVFLAFLCTGFFPLGVIYIAAALLMKRTPLLPTGHDPDWDTRLYRERRRPSGSLDERLERLHGMSR